MIVAKNLGNVKGPKCDPGSVGPTGPAGPKPAKTPIDLSTDVTANLDSKNRIRVNSDPLITGYKYIEIEVLNQQQTYNVPIYVPNTDTFVELMVFRYKDPFSGGTTMRAIIPTPFDYSLLSDGISKVTLVEKGTYWN